MEPTSGAVGRPRSYCRRSCRQRAYEARRRAAELGLAEHELVITRQQLDEMRDQIFVVCAAVNDATRTLPSLVDVDEARELIRWIADAASPLSGEFQQTP